ncbi:MAG: type IX secretion system PorP/SprF family membrane protein [Saprospiraceae bacterium]|jgi:type IX secretion system PorP/SprF family membrane protein
MRCFFITVFVLGFLFISKGQDPITSHPMGSYTEINPSMMGNDSLNTAYLNRRNQWPNIQGTYLTTRLGYHHYLKGINGYLGLSIMHENAGSGTFKTTNAALNYAQNMKINKVQIKIGAKVSVIQNILDWNKLTFGDQIDQQIGFISSLSAGRQGQQAISYLDFSMGSSIYWKGFTVGAAAFHFLEPSNGFIAVNSSVLPMALTFQISKTFSETIKGKEITISPYVNFSRQRDFESKNFGILSTYRWAILGFSFRSTDAFIAIIGVKTKYINLIYSYDLTVSKLYSNTGGSHEVSFIFHPFKKRKKAHKNLLSVKSPFML